MKEHKGFTWFVVTSQGGSILGVFGSALEDMARDCKARVERDTGFVARIDIVHGKRPSVGGML